MIFADIVETLTDGIVIFNINGQVTYANQAAAKLLQQEVNALKGQNYLKLAAKFKPVAAFCSTEELFNQALKANKPVSGEFSFRRLDGSEAFLLLWAKVYRDVSGKAGGVFFIIKDITAHFKLEQTLLTRQQAEAALNEISQAITATFDAQEIMQKVVGKATETLKVEAAAVCLREGNHWILRYATDTAEHLVGMIVTKEQATILNLTVKAKQPTIFNEAATDPRLRTTLWQALGAQAVLAVPVFLGSKIFGIITFLSLSSPAPFTQFEVDFVTKLTAFLSLALHNAQIYTEEHKIAATLQEQLMTMPKRISGLEFGYLYRSASPGAKIGGDFYDMYAVDKDKVAIVIGDVSGRGLEAAALTSVVKNTLKAYCLQGDSPALVMNKTNALVKKFLAPSMFITLFFGLFSKSTATLSYCSAGHPSVILKRAKKVFLLKTDSPVLGQFSKVSYEEHQQEVKAGDILIFYTDGLTEAHFGQEFFGQERLIKTVKELKFSSVKEIPKLLFHRVWQFSGQQLADDVAILAVSPGLTET
jgi:PAS domain S-box-containing protein